MCIPLRRASRLPSATRPNSGKSKRGSMSSGGCVANRKTETGAENLGTSSLSAFTPARCFKFAICDPSWIGRIEETTDFLQLYVSAPFTENRISLPTASATGCRGRSAQSQPIRFDGGAAEAVRLRNATYSRSLLACSFIAFVLARRRAAAAWFKRTRANPGTSFPNSTVESPISLLPRRTWTRLTIAKTSGSDYGFWAANRRLTTDGMTVVITTRTLTGHS